MATMNIRHCWELFFGAIVWRQPEEILFDECNLG